jgi:hypothetical protein
VERAKEQLEPLLPALAQRERINALIKQYGDEFDAKAVAGAQLR